MGELGDGGREGVCREVESQEGLMVGVGALPDQHLRESLGN